MVNIKYAHILFYHYSMGVMIYLGDDDLDAI